MKGNWRPSKDCNIMTPTLMTIIAFLSRSPGLLNGGAGGPAFAGTCSHSSIFSPTDLNSTWLNWGSWEPPLLGAGSLYSILSPTNLNFLCTELYYCFTPTQFNPPTVKVIPWHPRPDSPFIYTGAFLILTAWPGRRSIYNSSSVHLKLINLSFCR